MRRIWLAPLAWLAVSACNRPEVEDCRTACWTYNKVMFWDKAEKEIAGARDGEQDVARSAEEAARLRAFYEKEWSKIADREEDSGYQNCVTSCRADATKEQVACMTKATTATEMKSCME